MNVTMMMILAGYYILFQYVSFVHIKEQEGPIHPQVTSINKCLGARTSYKACFLDTEETLYIQKMFFSSHSIVAAYERGIQNSASPALLGLSQTQIDDNSFGSGGIELCSRK